MPDALPLDLFGAEIESALSQRSETQRAAILRQMADLFITTAPGLSPGHVELFDQVMLRLVEHIETEALIELSTRLAPVGNAPVKVIGRLSRNDDISVSGPVLERSPVLTDPDLVEIAQTKGQDHLAAIAGRPAISALVTAVLFGRGNAEIARKVATNAGATISSNTYEGALKRAQDDEALTAALAGRKDLPQELFERLVREATETVRLRLMARSDAQMRERITKVLATVAARTAQNPALRGGKPLFQPDTAPQRAQVMKWARSGDAPELVEALALLCRVPAATVTSLVRQQLHEGLVILGKSGGLSWPELQEVLQVAIPGKTNLTALFDKYASLSAPRAQIAASFLRTARHISRGAISALI
jgi:uncharacterized protein (DUF2336 family)